MIKAIYSGVGPGSTLLNAIYETSVYTPAIIQDWIDNQAKHYLSEDFDFERIHYLIWKSESQKLIDFFTRIGHDIDNDVYCISGANMALDYFYENNKEKFKSKTVPINRKIINVWVKMANDDERDAVQGFKDAFYKDLEASRETWASERAEDDFGVWINEIDKDDDKQVADFFGIELDIDGYYIDGLRYPIDELYICPTCGKPFLKDSHANNDDGTEDESMWYCDQCSDIGEYDNVFVKCNKHVPVEEIIARRV